MTVSFADWLAAMFIIAFSSAVVFAGILFFFHNKSFNEFVHFVFDELLDILF